MPARSGSTASSARYGVHEGMVVHSVLALVVVVSVGLGFAVGHGGLLVGGLPLPCVAAGLALAVNLAAWIPASVLRTERFYDLTGTLTYLAIVALALATAGADLTWRGALASGAVIVWAVRLGTFLVLRIRKDGKDGRFDTLKTTPARFLVPWSLQALWCAVCSVGVVGLVAQVGVAMPFASRTSRASGCGSGFGLRSLTSEVGPPRPRRAGCSTGLQAWSQHPTTGRFSSGPGSSSSGRGCMWDRSGSRWHLRC